jgi:uroporphyrin-III C-methyltransferase/precorrin-2 dehydrogenase/sirohydrochlorin ferrochelatase
MSFLPVFLDLSTGVVVLVGTGPQAVAKLHLLRAAGARVTWFLQDACTDSVAPFTRHYAGSIDVVLGEPDDADLARAMALVSAAGAEADERLSMRARSLGIPVNVVDRQDLSTFIFPAMLNRGDVAVAIGTGGASPVIARRIRERIEAILPARIGELAELMKRHRATVVAARKRWPGFSARRFWERIFDGPVGAMALSGRVQDAEAELTRVIEAAASFATAGPGVVHLVGAGPGDPDLLTLRALHVLQDADVVFYDELVTSGILDRARRDAERVFVGKRKGQPGIGQDEINRRLVEAAKAGKRVVRLKSGDPFVFGRGGEELEHLREAGIQTLVVPGITAALGCAAEAGLPLTFRKEASQLSFVTASTAGDARHIDWATLADPRITVVVYMGLSLASSVRASLIASGRDPQTPAAVLARGTQPDSRTVAGRLDDLPALAAAAGEGPALLVIGSVAARCRHEARAQRHAGLAA